MKRLGKFGTNILFIRITFPYTIYPLYPLLYSKTGIRRCIPIFLIFALKHRLWVLVRTASTRRFYRVPTIYVLSKNKRNIKIFLMKFSIFTDEKNLCILHGQVFITCTVSAYRAPYTTQTCPCIEYPLNPTFYILSIFYIFYCFINFCFKT